MGLAVISQLVEKISAHLVPTYGTMGDFPCPLAEVGILTDVSNSG